MNQPVDLVRAMRSAAMHAAQLFFVSLTLVYFALER
jgi:hypothetical protein